MKKTRTILVALATVFGLTSAFTSKDKITINTAYANSNGEVKSVWLADKGITWDCIINPELTCVYADPELTIPLIDGQFVCLAENAK